MKLNLFKRSIIFATFFGSCLCIALIVASLGTKNWIEARARRTSNSLKSEGRINFGLFEGHKELTNGYGWRVSEFSIKTGHPARRWAWCGTAALLGASLASASGSAILAALASAARTRASPRPLLISNTLAVVFTLGAVSVWLTEFFLRLQYNVMSEEDLSKTWSSDGMAELGLSFWLVVAASLSAFVNNVCVCVAMADEREEDSIAPAIEEKMAFQRIISRQKKGIRKEVEKLELKF